MSTLFSEAKYNNQGISPFLKVGMLARHMRFSVLNDHFLGKKLSPAWLYFSLPEEVLVQNENIPYENIGFNVLGNSWEVARSIECLTPATVMIPHAL